MSPRTVLVVEDHVETRQQMEAVVSELGHRVVAAGDGRSARAILAREDVDLIVLDRGLPDGDGLAGLADLLLERGLAVLVTSVRGSEDDRVLGLRAGADDYLPKPYSARELAARVEALLRRVPPEPTASRSSFGPLEIDAASREVTVRGRPVALTRREFDLLATLASEPRRVFSRAELLERVWGSRPEYQQASTVTEHVRRVRRKLGGDGPDPGWIRAVRGIGYRFEPPGGGDE